MFLNTKMYFYWWTKWDLNPRPAAYKAAALTAELSVHSRKARQLNFHTLNLEGSCLIASIHLILCPEFPDDLCILHYNLDPSILPQSRSCKTCNNMRHIFHLKMNFYSSYMFCRQVCGSSYPHNAPRQFKSFEN